MIFISILIAFILNCNIIYSNHSNLAQHLSLGSTEKTHDLVKRVHKFSIGKDFSSYESEDDATTDDYVSTKNKNIHTSTSRQYSMHSTTNIQFKPSRKNNYKSKPNPLFVDKKLDDIKKKLHSLNKDSSTIDLNTVLEDVLSSRQINYTNLLKGRTIEDTKAILSYMIIALHQINSKTQKNFDSIRFLDQIALDPTEVSPDGLFEKDIVLTKDQAYSIFSKYFINSSDRKYIKNSVNRWPTPIYYTFDDTHNYREKEIIRSALRRWEENTCLEFKELFNLKTQVTYVKFTKGNGCWSHLGYTGLKYQEVSIGESCLNKGGVLHQVGHILGFFHEQSKPNRKDYIDIIADNILAFRELNFVKFSDNEIEDLNSLYDLSSNLHFGSSYFTSNNMMTIVTKDNRYQKTIGQRNDLSFNDIKAANNAYCKNKCPFSLPCQRGGYPNPKNCNICICPPGFSGNFCDQLAQSNGPCGGLINNASGTFQTPNYPFYYPGFIECNWLIHAPIGYKIRLTFSKLFSTSCNTVGPCDKDWLEIRYDSDKFNLGGPRYCCNASPDTTVSSHNEMLVIFRSTEPNINSSGFKALYEIIDKSGKVIDMNKLNSILSTTQIPRVELDFCKTEPCLNGGSCSSGVNGFICTCPEYFTGVKCEMNLSKCLNVECRNNGICLENTGKCLCTTSFTGMRCESEIDSCASNPCIKGVCANIQNAYKCFCYANYTGARCEIDMSHKKCKDGLCLNNGKCVESPLLEGFLCQCPKNFNGILCEHSICSTNNACGENATCVLKEEGGYYCKCQDGSIGDNCRSHPCSTNICGNHGICERKGELKYACRCIPGYYGTNCEHKVDNCKSNPCANGACHDLGGISFECRCYEGFTGQHCDVEIKKLNGSCSSSPCQNNGICIQKSDKYLCFCPPGYVGKKCEFLYQSNLNNVCEEKNPCKNGRCVPMPNNNYKCECQRNWIGVNCDQYDSCLGNPCGNRGICVPTAMNDYACSCFTGYSGKKCELVRNECSEEFCNGGKCLIDHTNEKGFVCECLQNYSGPTCSYNLNSCASNPCSMDQICLNNDDSYVCVCIQGISCPNSPSLAPLYKRPNKKINQNKKFSYMNSLYNATTTTNTLAQVKNVDYLCKIGTCKNDGICQISSKTNDFFCKCKFGYIGRYCEIVNECLLKPNMCQNGGTCRMNGTLVTCQCKDDFEPPYCLKTKIKSVYCEVNVCKNGGTCVHNEFKNVVGMKCLCPNGYSGVFCEITKKLDTTRLHELMPSICKTSFTKSNKIYNNSLKMTRTTYSENSYYIIEDDYIWFIKENENLNRTAWPQKVSYIFPTMSGKIDAILFDESRNEFLIFKSTDYWKFKTQGVDPFEPTLMVKGYPRKIKEDFGLKNIESGFFVQTNKSNPFDEHLMLLFKDSKIVKFNGTRPIGIYFLPFEVTPLQFTIDIDSNYFYVFFENRFVHFMINYKNHQVNLKYIDSNLRNSKMCLPFLNMNSNQVARVNKPEAKLASIAVAAKVSEVKNKTKLRDCPDITTINSIVKLNSTAGLILIDDKLEFIEITRHGYKLIDNTKPMNLNLNKTVKTSMINLNRILFLFQNQTVWIYSILNDTLNKNEAPAKFHSLFPNKNAITSVIGSHYSARTKKFYFFSDKYYIEYENQNRLSKKTSIRNLSSKLVTVFQNHEDFDSVYLVDANSFVYYLNLKSDYLESVDRHTASLKLFTGCIHD